MAAVYLLNNEKSSLFSIHRFTVLLTESRVKRISQRLTDKYKQR